MNNKYIENSRRILVNAYKENEGENIVCSPLSFYMLLGMALNATRKQSQAEIREVLSNDLETTSITKYIATLKEDMTKEYTGGKTVISNGICVKDSLYGSIIDEFKECMAKTFDAEFFSADKDMVEKVNLWVNEKTGGMIQKLLDKSSPNTIAILMNAISFFAEWESQYEDEDIYEESEFTNFDGSVSEVTFLQSDESSYIEDDFYTGFVKDYKGGEYAFMALLPKKAKAKSFWKRALEQVDFKSYYDSRKSADVCATMPEFEMSMEHELTEFCKSLGMTSIFTENADFSAMIENVPLMVSSVLQKAYIKVDRAGTKASAASEMALTVGCAYNIDKIKYVCLDRPFIYAIIDKQSGLPIFNGIVNNL